jgi:DNA helicase-2/ATP-dependent DNA helicase PcrA
MVAVLTRTNAEALILGTHLQREGLPVRVQHRALDRGAAPWLAGLFGGVAGSRARIPDPAPSLATEWMSPPADLVRILRHTGLARDRDVDLDRLAAMVGSGAFPEELVARRDAPVTVSNIHRAKGLEFDTVFVVDVGRLPDQESVLEEARILYVAATRARDELLMGAALKWDGPVYGTSDGGRVKVCGWQERRRARLVEVKVCDFDEDWTPGGSAEFGLLQELLAERLDPGAPLELRLSERSKDEEWVYDLIHVGGAEETVIGRTSGAFGSIFRKEVGSNPPTRVTRLVAEIPDTARMSVAAADRVGLAEHGLHLRARGFGLGKLSWDR